jgi:hypothetical protein
VVVVIFKVKAQDILNGQQQPPTQLAAAVPTLKTNCPSQGGDKIV